MPWDTTCSLYCRCALGFAQNHGGGSVRACGGIDGQGALVSFGCVLRRTYGNIPTGKMHWRQSSEGSWSPHSIEIIEIQPDSPCAHQPTSPPSPRLHPRPAACRLSFCRSLTAAPCPPPWVRALTRWDLLEIDDAAEALEIEDVGDQIEEISPAELPQSPAPPAVRCAPIDGHRQQLCFVHHQAVPWGGWQWGWSACSASIASPPFHRKPKFHLNLPSPFELVMSASGVRHKEAAELLREHSASDGLPNGSSAHTNR